MLIDTHAHITFREYDKDAEDVIRRALFSDTYVINASSNYKTSLAAVKLAKKYDKGIWAMIGCHPDDLVQEDFDHDKYFKLAKSSSKVVAIGEVGLDFFRLPEDKKLAEQVKEKQISVFKQFLKLANELDLPLVLHCRGEANDPYGAYDLMLEILDQQQTTNNQQLKGVIHCFGGNLEQAKKFLDLGFYIGFTGIISFKNAKELQAIAQEIPLDKILIETDAPFLAPEPFRGQRNEPSYVKYVCQKIADLKGISFEEAEKATFDNAVKLFKLLNG